jgi:hypothetical protein
LAKELEFAGVGHDRKVPSLEQAAELASRNVGRVFEAQTLWLESLDALLQAAPDKNDDALLAPAPPAADAAPANQDTPARAPEKIRQMAGEEDIFRA